MKILIIDNYDSFTFNLVKLIRAITAIEPIVKRNDQCSLEEVNDYDKILLSPGPGIPTEAGNLLPLIRHAAPNKSILGVCLGHQAIAEAFGGTLSRLENVYHGIVTPVNLCNDNALFSNLPPSISVGRYHSWVVERKALPAELEILSEDEDGNIMALKHRKHNIYGVQFHPESIMTPLGTQIISNWINN